MKYLEQKMQDRIRVIKTKNSQSRQYALTRTAVRLPGFNRNYNEALKDDRINSRCVDTNIAERELQPFINELFSNRAIEFLTIRPYEITVTIRPAFDWDELEGFIKSCLLSAFFRGVHNVEFRSL